MATGQISRRRRLVAANLVGENAEMLRESEGEVASAAAEEEVFGLEEDPWPPNRSLGAVVLLHQISRRRRLVAADLAGENAEVLRESEGEEASAAALTLIYPNKFIGRFSLSLNLSNTLIDVKNSHHRRRIHGHRTDLSASSSRFIRSLGTVVSLQQILLEKTQKCFGRVKEKKPPLPRKRKCLGWSLTLIYPNKFIVCFSLSPAQPLKHSQRRQKLSPSKEDPWPPDRSLVAVVSLHQISRRRRLVAADLAGENAEVLQETEGEEASAAAEEEVLFGAAKTLTIEGGSMATGQISRRRRLVASDLSALSSRYSRSCWRKRRIYWSLLSLSLNLSNALIDGKNSPSKEDTWPPDRSLGAVVSLHQISWRRHLVAADLAKENTKVLRESEKKKPPPPRKRKCLRLGAALVSFIRVDWLSPQVAPSPGVVGIGGGVLNTSTILC
ncbi:uncharacterized protein G2W53_015280 [Senna tora]|uniref:Uncharacterized protein n=1 Tax=Senna tora TaxID=362788 RepID=A0A834WV72_9FABA|nr:uncharacterized protein G2W53_015280 [Senna tora]